MNNQCAQGLVDIQLTGGRPVEVFAPQYFFFNGPFVIRDYAHFERVWKGPLGHEAKALVEQNGNMVSLSTVYRGFRQMTSNFAILGPNEIIRLGLRLPVVPTWISVWRDGLEADPVAIPLTGLYDALRDGVAEASEGDLTQISSFRLYEVQAHLSITNHLVGVGWVFVNKTFFNGLSIANQERIAGAIKQASVFATAKMASDESGVLQSLEQQGMTIVTADAAAIRAKARPVVDSLFQTQWPVTTWEEVLAQ